MSLRKIYQEVSEGPFAPFFKELTSSIQEEGFGCEILDQSRSSTTLRISSDNRQQDFKVSVSRRAYKEDPFFGCPPRVVFDIEELIPEWYLPNLHNVIEVPGNKDWLTAKAHHIREEDRFCNVSERVAICMIKELASMPVNKKTSLKAENLPRVI